MTDFEADFEADFEEEICCWQVFDVVDVFGHFGDQNPLFFYITAWDQST